jgi:hypothetical protein
MNLRAAGDGMNLRAAGDGMNLRAAVALYELARGG